MSIFLAIFFALAFVWPAARLRLRTGEWGVVSQRGADACQRLVGVLVALWFLAIGAWALACDILPHASLGISTPWPRLGWTLMLGGLVLVVAAQAQMGASWRVGIDDRPTVLAQGGLFAWIRNPIFAGMLLALGGVVALSPSAASAVGWVAVAQLIAVQVRLEETHLLRLHGDAYARYAARVGRFVPALGRLSGELRRAA
jgi:protein-S-isoprenylcysteine O-methyltransferase Ste14